MESENFQGLYFIFMKRLKEIKTNSNFISFPDVFEKLCRNFSIKKEECWKILRYLKNIGAIEITFSHGITIKDFEKIRVEEVIK
jgi:hypothetical protein